MQENSALVLEILKEGKFLTMSVLKRNEFASTLKQYSQMPVVFSDIDRLCFEVTAILNKAQNKSSVALDLAVDLKKAGQLLWDHLLTKPIKDRLRQAESQDLILSLDEELINIPWEILFTGDDFLCLKFNLGRLIRTKEFIPTQEYRSFPSKIKMLVLANPTSDLRSAYNEGVYIKNQLDKRRKEINIDFKSTYIDTLFVKRVFRDYDIVHFAGHCEYDAARPENSGWVLSDGRFTTEDIHRLAETANLPNLVFSNGCYSAQSAAGGIIPLDYQRETYSLASAFLFSGVRHYIGTACKIEDSVSLDFAKEFYAQLLAGKSVGECMRLGRLRLTREYGISAISWASYLLYGDPNFILFKAAVKPKTARPKRKILLNKRILLRLGVAAIVIALGTYLYIWLPSINPGTYYLFSQSKKMFSKGDNYAAVELSQRIIAKDQLFLAAYPLLAESFERLGNRDEELKCYFNYALACEKKRDKPNLADAYLGIGWVYHLKGQYAQAQEFYQKAVDLSIDNQDKLHEAVGLRKLAVWYTDKGEFDRAFELLMKSSEINRQRQANPIHRYNLACDYFDIGLVFSDKNDYSAAKDFYLKSKELFERLKLKEELSDYYFNLGEIYLLEKQHQKALEYYLKGLGIDQAHKNQPGIASDYNMIGELFMAMDDSIQAEKYFKESIALSRQLNIRPELAAASYNLGMLYKNKNQRSKMREFLRQAQEIYWSIDTPEYQKIKQEFLALGNN